MKLQSIRLKNFRSYSNADVFFSPDVNSIVGKNAQGKTNLIEAIYFACIGKSFRTSKEKELIKWGEERASISIVAKNEFREKKIDVILQKSQKKIVRMDEINIRRIGDVLGEVPIVFFSPDELKLVKESPEERRRFMNIDISQTNKRYFYLISRYEKILDNRNKLLKSTQNKDVILETIDIWNKALASAGLKIANERKQFIREIAPYAEKANEFISNGEKLQIAYKGIDVESEEEYIKKLEKSFDKDFKLGFTSYGPHRDDIDIFLNGVEVKSFGSQGQQRTAALSLKLAELEIIRERTGEYPILILDDVFSELDENRRKRLLKFTNRCQTFITTTDINFTQSLANNIIIDDGKISIAGHWQ